MLDEAAMRVVIGPNRTVASIEVTPERPGIDGLVGTQGGSRLRRAIDTVLPGERDAATPLHLLLDDIAGTSLVGGFAWSRWREDLAEAMHRGAPAPVPGTPPSRTTPAARHPQRPDHLLGASPRRMGATATRARPPTRGTRYDPPETSPLPTDPWGWHEWPETPPVCMRRHRRIDVRPAGDSLVVDAFFRDSVWEPDGSEMALHEYTVQAEVDAATLSLIAVDAVPARAAVSRVPVGRTERRPARGPSRRRIPRRCPEPDYDAARQARSNGSRQASGATSWWMALGPHDPGGYGRTGGGFSSSGFDRSHRLSMPSALLNSVWSPLIAS